MDGSGPDAEILCYPQNPLSGGEPFPDAFGNCFAHRATPEPLALAPRPSKARFDPLDYNAALALRKKRPSSETSPQPPAGWEPILGLGHPTTGATAGTAPKDS
jgi:hypothetical protein